MVVEHQGLVENALVERLGLREGSNGKTGFPHRISVKWGVNDAAYLRCRGFQSLARLRCATANLHGEPLSKRLSCRRSRHRQGRKYSQDPCNADRRSQTGHGAPRFLMQLLSLVELQY